MLQDANLNVVGLCRPGAPAGAVEMVRQDVYSPYGETIATDLFDQTAPDNRVGFQGMFFDRFAGNAADPQVTPGGDGLYRTANRSYHPTLGRWLQRDPNATAQPIVEALVRQRYSGSRFEGSRDDEIPGRGVWRREHECGSDSILAAGVGCAVGGVSGLF
jgi:RHS repeat-associated protein